MSSLKTILENRPLVKIAFVVFVCVGIFILLNRASSHHKGATLDSNVSVKDMEAAEQDLLKEMVSKDMLISKGNVGALKLMYERKFGLKLRQLKQKEDGTYDLVLEGGDEVHFKSSPALSKKEEARYTREFMGLWNEGKQIEINARDRKQIMSFRRGVSGF